MGNHAIKIVREELNRVRRLMTYQGKTALLRELNRAESDIEARIEKECIELPEEFEASTKGASIELPEAVVLDLENQGPKCGRCHRQSAGRFSLRAYPGQLAEHFDYCEDCVEDLRSYGYVIDEVRKPLPPYNGLIDDDIPF
jgi:hypothetical protein